MRTGVTLGFVATVLALVLFAPTQVSVLWAGPPLKAIPLDFQPHSQRDRTNRLPDGIYLYGQSSTPEQLQKEYFVFEVHRGKVIGAFYLPRSAFYCFWGILQTTRLDVTVVDTFDRTTSPYSVNLPDYYRISTVSNNDRRILGICKDNYQQQVGEQ
ncbi:MAG: hypothetical protein ACM37W_04525 [Actinomycetota bacterium]